MKKICVVTATRAEYGLLRPLIDKIDKDSELELQLLVTGAHLSTEFGLTYKFIEEDGYVISKKVEMLLSSDTPTAIVKSMGLEMVGMADAINDLSPELIVLLGDRYESLVVASVATIFRIPVAHLHGGEATEGLIDEAIRHSITKMSMLHFASTNEYANRIVQLGESPDRVFNVGALGIENIKKMHFLSKEELEKQIDFRIDENTVLVTFHPVTLENNSSAQQFRNILEALEEKRYKVIFTKANADTDGRVINKMIDEYVKKNPQSSISYVSMGQLRYLSALKYVKMVVGNSSSGIIEAPSFNIPTIDIGDRQKGRVSAESVIHCEPERSSIVYAMNQTEKDDFVQNLQYVKNPYEGIDTSETIIVEIKKYLENNHDVKKEFYNLNLK